MYHCHNTGFLPSPLWSIAIAVAVIAIPFHPTFHPVMVFSTLCPPAVYLYPISDPLPYPLFPSPAVQPPLLLPIPHSPHHFLPWNLQLQPLFSFTINLFQELILLLPPGYHYTPLWTPTIQPPSFPHSPQPIAPTILPPRPLSAPLQPGPFPVGIPHTPAYSVPGPCVQPHKPNTYAHPSPFSTPSGYNPSPLSSHSPKIFRPLLSSQHLLPAPNPEVSITSWFSDPSTFITYPVHFHCSHNPRHLPYSLPIIKYRLGTPLTLYTLNRQ